MQAEPHLFGRLLRCRRHGLRNDVWQSKYFNYQFRRLTRHLLAALYWKIEERDQGPHSVEADPDQAVRHPSRLVSGSSRLHQ